MPQQVPALEIGGTHVTAAVVDMRTGRVMLDTVQRRSLRAGGSADEIISDILACATDLDVSTAGGDRASGGHGRRGPMWGVAIPGPFDYARGIGLFRDVAKFDSLYGVDLGRALMDGLGAAGVTFLNDADAFVLGEWKSGAASGHTRAAGITIGTGIGSAFLAGGVIVDDGPDVPPEGNVHLLTIGGRPLEDTVSRRAILARYGELAADPLGPGTDVRDLAQRAREGDQVAAGVFASSFGALGEALGPWLRRFGATALVVGGAIARAWDLVAPPLTDGLQRHSTIQVTPAAHPDEAALIGAAQWAGSPS
jgi:glucokinase